MPNTYTIPQGLENSVWEQYRRDSGIVEITEENRAGVMAGFELYKQNKQLQERYTQQATPGSQLYQQHRQYLASATPQIGTNALLAPLMAGGGNQAASQLQAGALRDEYRGERNDFLNTSTRQFGLGMQGQANSLLGQLSNNAQFSGNLAEQQRQFDEANSTDFWDVASSLVAPIASIALAPMTGGASMAGMAMPSDRRLKENIEKVGVSQGGVNIYEFNYKGGDTRYRGAIADENPQASIEKNGIKYLDYSKIDVDFEVV